MTGNKLANEKYYHHTGWLGGLKVKTAKEFLEKDPTGFVEHAVKGMLPHNTLGRAQGMKLFVYAGPDHPHAAQKPEELKVKG
jgi:large subunit ribosomal protein L13